MAYIVMAYIGMACVGMAYVVMGCVVMVYNTMADIVMAYVVMAYIGEGHAFPCELKDGHWVPFLGKLQLGDLMLLDATSPHAGPAPGDTRRIGDTIHGHACACVHMPMHMWRQSCVCRDLRHSAATFQRRCLTL